MAKTHTFKELFQNWQKAKNHLVEVTITLGELKKGEHAYNYHLKYVKDAERAEKFWIEKMGDYGRGTIIQATGLMHESEISAHILPFTMFLVNAEIQEIKEYLKARFPLIKKETIELKEFQTGILNV